MNHITLRGAAGEVRWAYHLAASLGAWTLESGRLSAEITAQDSFRISQAPLAFVVARANGAWRWPIRSMDIVGSTLTATLDMEDHEHGATDTGTGN
jgi:hypothetical protein